MTWKELTPLFLSSLLVFFSPGLQADLGRRRRGRRRRSCEVIRVCVRVGWALQLQNKKPQSQVGLLLLASQLISSPSLPACLPARLTSASSLMSPCSVGFVVKVTQGNGRGGVEGSELRVFSERHRSVLLF